MGIFKPRAKPDLSLLKGAQIYKPYRPEPESGPFESMILRDPSIADVLRQDGHICTHIGSNWYRSNAIIERDGCFVLRNGRALTRHGTHVEWLDGNSPDRDRTAWGISMREAADALISVFGQGSAPVTPDQIGDSNDGIEPCGYDVL